jgi:outer membrane lipase/esterase
MDYRLTDDFYVGTAFGYTGSKSDIYMSPRKVEGDVYSYSLYSTYANPQGFHLDGLVRVGWHDYTGKRNKGIRSDFTGNDYAASLGGGYDLQFKQLTVNPFVRYDYVHFTTNGYQETGVPGSGTLFNIGRQDVDSMRTALGLELNYALSTHWGVITPVLGAEWQHEYMNDNHLISATNQAAQVTNFSQSGNPDRDFMNFNVGFSTVLPHGISGFFMYDTMLANTYTATHSFNAGVRVEF